MTTARNGAQKALTGYREPVPMVYSGLYPVDGSDYPVLREALEKLQLNDAALTFEPETSVALGFGFRCGFLGLLHMEITPRAPWREFDLDLISTAPNVVYRVVMDDGAETSSPTRRTGRRARRGSSAHHEDDDHRAQQVHRRDHGAVPVPARGARRHGLPLGDARRDPLHAADGRDHLRLLRLVESRTRGYASLDYEESGEAAADLVKVDILLQGEPSTRSARSSTAMRPMRTATRWRSNSRN